MLSIWFVHITSLPDVVLYLPSEVRVQGKGSVSKTLSRGLKNTKTYQISQKNLGPQH